MLARSQLACVGGTVIALCVWAVIVPADPGAGWAVGFLTIGIAGALFAPAALCLGPAAVVAFGVMWPEPGLGWALGLVATGAAAICAAAWLERLKCRAG